MRIKQIVLTLLLAPLLCGCEHIIDFNDSGEKYDYICANALAVPGHEFTVSVSRTSLFTDVPPLSGYKDFLAMLRGQASISDIEDFLLPKAEVKLTVNGQQEYALHYDEERGTFSCPYMPTEGDALSLHVEADGYPAAQSETVIPQSQRLEVLGSEKYYSKRDWASSSMSDLAADTLMRLTLRINDPAGERNYYRLKVRSVGEDIGYEGWTYSDIYSSSDAIFMDDDLTEAFGGWPARFSNVFDDRLFDGQAYTLTVESRMRLATTTYVVVELQSLTPDLYRYLKSFMRYRIMEQDAYTESVQIYSNVSGGWGIVGGLAGDRHVVPF